MCNEFKRKEEGAAHTNKTKNTHYTQGHYYIDVILII